ncbi:MAG: hypothetical protein ACI80L_000182 [Pseudohongiellaceae bacterium]|jgi:hypothetical protein
MYYDRNHATLTNYFLRMRNCTAKEKFGGGRALRLYLKDFFYMLRETYKYFGSKE